MSNQTIIKSEKYQWCKTELIVRPNKTPGFEGLASLSIETGCARLHTYPTRDELLALADMLREHAETMEAVNETA